ncbi:MAG: ribosome maturation factor RimP [Demequina sp.]
MDIQQRIADLAQPGADAAGLVVDGVTVSPAGKRTRVLVTVDLPQTEVGSAELDRVAEASRSIGQALDEANVPSTPYTLEVSTPGTDRPLTQVRHFMRARTRKVTLEMTDGTSVTGRLADLTDGQLMIEVDGDTRAVPVDDVERGHIQVELRREPTHEEG